MAHIVQQVARRLRQQGGKANDEPAEDEGTMGAVAMAASRANSRGPWLEKLRRLPDSSQEPSQMAVVKNVAR